MQQRNWTKHQVAPIQDHRPIIISWNHLHELSRQGVECRTIRRVKWSCSDCWASWPYGRAPLRCHYWQRAQQSASIIDTETPHEQRKKRDSQTRERVRLDRERVSRFPPLLSNKEAFMAQVWEDINNFTQSVEKIKMHTRYMYVKNVQVWKDIESFCFRGM